MYLWYKGDDSAPWRISLLKSAPRRKKYGNRCNKGSKNPWILKLEQHLPKNWEIIEVPTLTKFSHPEDGGGMFLRGVVTNSINTD